MPLLVSTRRSLLAPAPSSAPSTTPEIETLWDDGSLLAWDDGALMVWG